MPLTNHAKIVLIDRRYTINGTRNMDIKVYKSFAIIYSGVPTEGWHP
jgi:hypothetical protein